jgi:hypothetical protein
VADATESGRVHDRSRRFGVIRLADDGSGAVGARDLAKEQRMIE